MTLKRNTAETKDSKNVSVTDIEITSSKDKLGAPDGGPSKVTSKNDLIEWCNKWRFDREKFFTFPRDRDCIPKQFESLVYRCEKPNEPEKTEALLLDDFQAAYLRHMSAQLMGWVIPEHDFVKCVCQARLKPWYENAYKTGDGTLQVIKEYACNLAMQDPRRFMATHIEKMCATPENYDKEKAAVMLRAFSPEFLMEQDRFNRERLTKALGHFHNSFPDHPAAERVDFALGVFIWQAARDQAETKKQRAYIARAMDILASHEEAGGELGSLSSLAIAVYSAKKGQCPKAIQKLEQVKGTGTLPPCPSKLQQSDRDTHQTKEIQ